MAGRYVVSELRNRQIEVDVCGRRQWDLRRGASRDELHSLFGAADVIVHAGAIVPLPGQHVAFSELLAANVAASSSIAEFCAAHDKALVHISGAVVYANSSARNIGETAPLADIPNFGGMYALSKRMAETVVRAAYGGSRRLCVLRPSSVYGRGMADSRTVPRMLRLAEDGSEILIEPPSDDRINLVHAGDLAQAVAASIEKEAWGIFNIGAPSTVTLQEIAETCVEVAGRGRVRVNETGNVRPPQVRYDIDSSKAVEVLGYRARSLAAGLREVVTPHAGCAT